MGSEALTYEERKALGFGTVKERLGKDSHGNYNDCCLTLQPAVNPVVTPDGYLYSREAILENLLQQKKGIKRKLAEWEAAQKAEDDKATQKAAVEAEAALIAFDRANHMGLRDETARGIQTAITAEAEALLEGKGAGAKGVVSLRDNEERLKTLNAFWVPSKAPEAKLSKEKPDGSTYCPASGKKLRLKDLVDVKFTPVGEGDAGLFMDPITKDTFTNTSRLVVLTTTGDVLLEGTYEKCVKPDGVFKGKKTRVT
ncbi:Nitric oxide synthase-interacting protein [Monoraphidium neglectum]|uniref:Nitric oxide synthase-interacting protein n=1 Tax=Monoraphidium neglectum TaxID=145388 RepID=A0A0D2J0F9_9CHLO|nr:Nitric oxide synthase-interacting protein [Monoraphidium neglectum]KIY93552.1 Nitric oxide synthase-interacting protein [Monoraphidium neglectum]|eukprot:XP_013892572.1 Nitric oxide synthase-interacting protein [Monoraphidium neglectum]